MSIGDLLRAELALRREAQRHVREALDARRCGLCDTYKGWLMLARCDGRAAVALAREIERRAGDAVPVFALARSDGRMALAMARDALAPAVGTPAPAPERSVQ